MTDHKTLVVAKMIREYIKAKSGYQTSAQVYDELTKIIEKILDSSMEHCHAHGRITVMGRDVVDVFDVLYAIPTKSQEITSGLPPVRSSAILRSTFYE